uniref:non-specific serine/threonine protein kinase n=1 Tax=Aegilops tauschii subsp. strangulata TaxID=200361 RepID=A0A452Y5J3_AEGTS
VHWRSYLKFPENPRLSPEAKDLICRFLCDVDHRIGSGGADQIKAHPWFHGVEWDKLYEMEAAFKPQVNDELDTQNFQKFDEVNPAPARTGSGSSRKMIPNSKDLSFVGYTYKNFEAVKGLRQSAEVWEEAPRLQASLVNLHLIQPTWIHQQNPMEAKHTCALFRLPII